MRTATYKLPSLPAIAKLLTVQSRLVYGVLLALIIGAAREPEKAAVRMKKVLENIMN